MAAAYANGGGPAGSGGAAAGIGGVDGGVDDVELLPMVAGPAGVLGIAVLPAPPRVGGEVDVEVGVVGFGVSAVLVWVPLHATVTAVIVTSTPTPATAAATFVPRCRDVNPTPVPSIGCGSGAPMFRKVKVTVRALHRHSASKPGAVGADRSQAGPPPESAPQFGPAER